MNEELRKLIIKSFHIEDVMFGKKTSINDHILTINSQLEEHLIAREGRIQDITIDILKPSNLKKEVNTIMDVIPISTKVLGDIGEGITHTLTGVYIVLTGVDATGKQLGEFGSSEGILEEQLMLGRAGTPSKNDMIIHFDVTLKAMDCFNREWVNVVFKTCDDFTQKIRVILKEINGRLADERHQFIDGINKKGHKKVVIVKQVAGQGAMYDNLILPNEPSGFTGGKSIIDLQNMPIMLSPNEYRDGALRALT
jgi:D-proline reductase (dithiol) PrdD